VRVAALLLAVCAAGCSEGTPVPPRADLSGTWQLAQAVSTSTLRREVNGTVITTSIDRGAMVDAAAPVPGALPFTEAPAYKPEFRDKVRALFDTQSKVDAVFYCGRPGVPRVGPPRRIIQLDHEVVFLYEDESGNTFRIIPTDGRPHRADANPTHYGDSVGRWEGNTLVVDARNFVEETWFGEGGYFHTDALRVIERLWRDGEHLVWQVTVHDPNVLEQPWTMAPRVVKPSAVPLEESPPCIEQDGDKLLNNDHHGQRLSR
jgi:hypothetical protein